MKNHNLLLVDTITTKAGMTIRRDKKLFFVPFGEKFNYSRDLVKVFDTVLKKAHMKPVDLAGVLVVTGPGSYTSIRIGVSFANALGFAQNIPVQGLTLFEAAPYKKGEVVIAEAGRGNIFCFDGTTEKILPEGKLKRKHVLARVDTDYVFSLFEDNEKFTGPVSAHYILPPNISKPQKK